MKRCPGLILIHSFCRQGRIEKKQGKNSSVVMLGNRSNGRLKICYRKVAGRREGLRPPPSWYNQEPRRLSNSTPALRPKKQEPHKGLTFSFKPKGQKHSPDQGQLKVSSQSSGRPRPCSSWGWTRPSTLGRKAEPVAPSLIQVCVWLL